MDSQSLTNFLKVLLILGGIGSLIFGIVKVIMAGKKGKGIFSRIITIAVSVMAAIICFVGSSAFSSEMKKTGENILANHPASINSITYGQAIENVCGNIEWSRVTAESSSNNRAFVQMNADCTYDDKERKIVIQFDYGTADLTAVDESTPFKISFVGFDDDSQVSVSDMEDIIYSMFEFYASDHQIELDETMKEGLLYTSGWPTDSSSDKTEETSTDTEGEPEVKTLPITFVNSTGVDIYCLYASSTNTDNWEEDILDQDMLPAGESFIVDFTFTTDEQIWDFAIEDFEGNVLEFYDLDFSQFDEEGGTIVLNVQLF